MGPTPKNDREPKPSGWDGQERRTQVAQDIRAYIDERLHSLVGTAVDAALTRHVADLKELIMSGYPNDDPDGHRRYHEAQIKMMEDRAAMYRSIRDKTLSGLVWMLLVAMGTAVFEYAKRRVHIN